MNAREIVRRTLDFESPCRVARSFGDSDLVSASFKVESRAAPWREIGAGRWERTDLWGNTWGRIDQTSKGEVLRGVLDSARDAEEYALPDFSRPESYDGVRRKRAQHPERWLLGGLPGFAFNIARKLLRLDRYLEELLLEQTAVHRLHDRIDEALEAMIRNYAAAGADGVMFPEDWGTQTGLLINPALWRREFFPRFGRLCGLAHALGLRVFMHSCGQISAIVPSLIEAGVDALQFDQPDLHGILTLARYQEGARITFWCPVDIQKALQTRDEQLIRARAREMLEELWRGRGGFIAGFYGDNASIGLDPCWQEYACDEWIRRGVPGSFSNAKAQRTA